MKMSYLRDNRISKVYKPILVTVVIFTVIYFWGGGIFRTASSTAVRTATPILNIGVKAKDGLHSFFSIFAFKKTLYEENDSLKREAEALRLRLISADELLSENSELKNILGRIGDKEVVLSAVLSKPNLSPYDSLIIDVGKKLDVKIGSLVMVDGDIAIGTIVNVYPNSSKVELFSSPGNYMDVLLGEENITVSAKGKGSGNFEIELPRDIAVGIGDIVSVSDLGIKILGTVEYIEKEPSNPFQIILFKNPVNMNSLKWVQVVK